MNAFITGIPFGYEKCRICGKPYVGKKCNKCFARFLKSPNTEDEKQELERLQKWLEEHK